MAIDTTTPRSRRALLFGALGGAIATAAAVARPATTLAGEDGDVVLDANNTAAGTTQISGTADAPVLRVASEDNVGAIGASGSAVVDIPPPIETSTGLYGVSVAGHGVYGASDTGIGVYAANNSATKAAIVAEGATWNGDSRPCQRRARAELPGADRHLRVRNRRRESRSQRIRPAAWRSVRPARPATA